AGTSVLLDAAADPSSPLGRALALAIASAADATVRDVLREATIRRDALTKWIRGSVDRATAELTRALGLASDDELARVNAEIVNGRILPSSDWAAVAAICRESSRTDQDQCDRLTAAAKATGSARVEAYLSAFVTKDAEPRKNVITRTLGKEHPALEERLAREQ